MALSTIIIRPLDVRVCQRCARLTMHLRAFGQKPNRVLPPLRSNGYVCSMSNALNAIPNPLLALHTPCTCQRTLFVDLYQLNETSNSLGANRLSATWSGQLSRYVPHLGCSSLEHFAAHDRAMNVCSSWSAKEDKAWNSREMSFEVKQLHLPRIRNLANPHACPRPCTAHSREQLWQKRRQQGMPEPDETVSHPPHKPHTVHTVCRSSRDILRGVKCPARPRPTSTSPSSSGGLPRAGRKGVGMRVTRLSASLSAQPPKISNVHTS